MMNWKVILMMKSKANALTSDDCTDDDNDIEDN